MAFKTMAEIRKANRASGNYWFDRETMKFWKSKIESGVLKGRYFVTSEQKWDMSNPHSTERWYALRYANDDGTIRTVASCLPSKEHAVEHIAADRSKA